MEERLTAAGGEIVAAVERFFEPRWTPARHPLASLQ